ncbi:MAG: 23S rRNA (adenine(2503)-C(2))-methyltransferase RlmN [Bacteroidia bacterium]|nr:23S rRNA (adenine(2503)-C(2))-methyltransferase RlmN [Bacteroidia bacterium]NNC85488.1 23S rRNA (adenine(2503)-C(2))-methyltransferase RlmN [Bacteroidia bacterium]
MLKDIRELTLEEIEELVESWTEPKYRATQIYEWLWQKSAHTFDDMTNLSKGLRDKLKEHYVIHGIEPLQTQVSNDRTIKNAFKLHDANIVEAVLIPTKSRMTVCVSSQVGCSLTCSFCATGKLKRIRNLTAGEIYDQVAMVNKQAIEEYEIPLSNIVYMGMGEPLLNYQNVLKSIEHITSPEGLNMSPSRITLSTAGVTKLIKKLGDDEVKFNLAVSLHAANDEKRSELMPINDANSLAELKEAIVYFYSKTGTRLTYEYIMFHQLNDTMQDAKELAEFCKITPCKINLIEYNPVEGDPFKCSSSDRIGAFKNFLEQKNLIVNVRRSRGKDIDAACGQLANKNIAN